MHAVADSGLVLVDTVVVGGDRARAEIRPSADLRIAEVVDLDMQLEDGKVVMYRAKIAVSFKYEGGS